MAGKLTAAEQEKFGIDSYYDRGATKTKANKTLFVAFRDATVNIPSTERAAMCERLFSENPGYVGVRQVRGMCFIDFADIKSATSAMMKHQGTTGLTIDYDKDTGVAVKRQRENDEATQRNVRRAQAANYFCVECGTKALKTASMLLSAMPARSTDGARVLVDELKGLDGELLLEPIASAQPARVKREKGSERQYRLGCRSCSATIAYRCVPRQQEGKYLYVHPAAVRERSPTPDELYRRRIERRLARQREATDEAAAAGTEL